MRRMLFGPAAGLAALIGATGTFAGEMASSGAEPGSIGRGVYQQHCASCHGETGKGAPNWRNLNDQGELPSPPHDSTGHTWRHSDGMLYRMVREGWRDPFNKTERLTMPAFREVLTANDIKAVISYLKTLWTPEQRRFQQRESQRQPFPAETR